MCVWVVAGGHALPPLEPADAPFRFTVGWSSLKSKKLLSSTLSNNSLMGRWMPEGFEHTNDAYLGELPWATVARENADSWSCPRFPTDKAPLS